MHQRRVETADRDVVEGERTARVQVVVEDDDGRPEPRWSGFEHALDEARARRGCVSGIEDGTNVAESHAPSLAARRIASHGLASDPTTRCFVRPSSHVVTRGSRNGAMASTNAAA